MTKIKITDLHRDHLIAALEKIAAEAKAWRVSSSVRELRQTCLNVQSIAEAALAMARTPE